MYPADGTLSCATCRHPKAEHPNGEACERRQCRCVFFQRGSWNPERVAVSSPPAAVPTPASDAGGGPGLARTAQGADAGARETAQPQGQSSSARVAASRPSEALVGFVGVFETADRAGYLGAAMVTNDRGYPLEFRVSTPIRPSAVQRALYGHSLEPYIEGELVGKLLVGELKRRPLVLMVNRLGLLDAHSPVPVAFVARADSFVRTEGDGLRYRRIERGEDPSRALAVASTASDEELRAAMEHISLIVHRFDPVEAFDRMQTALNVLAESDHRYT